MNPTSVPLFNSQTPAAPVGFQNAKWQTDGQTPVQQITANVPSTGGLAVKTASYTLTASDCGWLLVYNSASAGTFTLPAAPPFAQWQVSIANIGTGALTVAPNGLQLDGSAASLTLTQNQGVALATDGANYFSERGTASGAPLTFQPFLIGCFLPGLPGAGAIVLAADIPSNLSTVSFPANFSGSTGKCGTNPTALATYTINQNGSPIGTIAISAAGVFSFTTAAGTAVPFAAGDELTVAAPGTQDATLSDVRFTLAGTR